MTLKRLLRNDLKNIIEDSISKNKLKTKISPLQKNNKIIGHELLFELSFEYKNKINNFKYSYYNPILKKEIEIKNKLDLLDAFKYYKIIDKITMFHIEQAYKLYLNSDKKNKIYYSINVGPVEMESENFQQELLKIANNNIDFFKTLQFEILEDPSICLQKKHIKTINGIKIHDCSLSEYSIKHKNTIKFLSLVKNLGAKITLDDLDAKLLNINRLDDIINILKELPQGEIIKNNKKLEYKFLIDKNNNIITKNELDKFKIKLDKSLVQSLTVHDYLIKKYEYKEGNILISEFLKSKQDFDRIKNIKYKNLEDKVKKVISNKLSKNDLFLSISEEELFDFLIVEKLYQKIENNLNIKSENNKNILILNSIKKLGINTISKEDLEFLLKKIKEDKDNIKDKFIESHLIQSLFKPISEILRKTPLNNLDIEGPIDPVMIKLVNILNENIALNSLSEITLEFIETESQAKNVKNILSLYGLNLNQISIIFQGDYVQNFNENIEINSNLNNLEECPIKRLETYIEGNIQKKLKKDFNNDFKF